MPNILLLSCLLSTFLPLFRKMKSRKIAVDIRMRSKIFLWRNELMIATFYIDNKMNNKGLINHSKFRTKYWQQKQDSLLLGFDHAVIMGTTMTKHSHSLNNKVKR